MDSSSEKINTLLGTSFGKIVDNKILLNQSGNLLEVEIEKISKIRLKKTKNIVWNLLFLFLSLVVFVLFYESISLFFQAILFIFCISLFGVSLFSKKASYTFIIYYYEGNATEIKIKKKDLKSAKQFTEILQFKLGMSRLTSAVAT